MQGLEVARDKPQPKGSSVIHRFAWRMRVSPLRPLSMMAFQATAEGGDRCAVVIDKGLRGEKIASMRTMAQ
jgi:hypothetical protein